jgi:hypothetical protein
MHLYRNFSIHENDLVVEIGGGAHPYFRSDVLLDKFLSDPQFNFQRGDSDLAIDRPFIHFDGIHTPFLDQQCNYIMLSHVIEHIPVEEIHDFIRELNRIGQAGYIEAPSILFEHMAEVPAHMWFVLCKDQCLYLAPRTNTPYQRWLRPVLDSMGMLIEDLNEIFFTGMEWHGQIHYQILDSGEELAQLMGPIELAGLARHSILKSKEKKLTEKNTNRKRFLNPLKIMKSVARRAGLIPSQRSIIRRSPSFSWQNECVCPLCYSPLQIQHDRIFCSGCSKPFKILPGDIPSFVL